MADLAYRAVYAMNKTKARAAMVSTYQETRSISETARRWHTSRQTVRKWVRRYEAEGPEGLQDRSRRPHASPRQTPDDVGKQVLEAWERTRYGRHRLALFLRAHGLDLSPHTIRHILRRLRPPQKRKRRKSLYPALWAWDQEQPFSLLQTDVKDIHDKQALGTVRITHLHRQRLPRYQWTACDGRTRVRFLAYSHRLHRTNGIAFMVLVLMWLRAHGVETAVTFQTDWGQEFGGDNPARIAQLSRDFLAPLQGELRRYPLGRKGYNGRVERSHRSDDEEFYRPYLLKAQNTPDLLRLALHWVFFYNVVRPHFGQGMERDSPLRLLTRLGYQGPETLVAFPPLLLDPISTELTLACRAKTGNDLLARYTGVLG
jgi:transposase